MLAIGTRGLVLDLLHAAELIDREDEKNRLSRFTDALRTWTQRIEDDMMAGTLDEVGDLLEAVDPGAAYWISEGYENPVHIQEVMNIELRRIAAETGRCFGREYYTHGQLGFWNTIPWYYQYLRQLGLRASVAYWIATQPFIEFEIGVHTVTLPYGDVKVDIGTRCEAERIPMHKKVKLRRAGLTTEQIAQREMPNRWVTAKTRDQIVVAVVPDEDPYITNAKIQQMIAKAILGQRMLDEFGAGSHPGENAL